MPARKRLIGIDLDGTLLRGSDEIQADDLASLLHAEALGVPVVIATGRSHFSSQPVVDRTGLNTAHICYNGAWAVAPGGGLLRDLRVPLGLSREVLARCRDMGVAVRAFVPDGVLMSQVPGPDEQFFKYRPFEQVDIDLADTLSEPPMQLVIVHLDDVSAFCTEFAGTHIEHDLHWLVTGRDPETPHLWALHLLHAEGMKGKALGQLCNEWGVDPQNVLAFGDGPNDPDMLKWAGTGVSFPWGLPEAQEAADLITEENDPHPIATVVYDWLEHA